MHGGAAMKRPWWARSDVLLYWLERWAPAWLARPILRAHGFIFRGARRVELSGDTAGEYSAPGVVVRYGGACPVQGRGDVDGFLCYYRSRGEGWQFHVYPQDGMLFGDDVFVFEERKYHFPEGGWVAPEVSNRCIERAVLAFRAARFAAEVDWIHAAFDAEVRNLERAARELSEECEGSGTE